MKLLYIYFSLLLTVNCSAQEQKNCKALNEAITILMNNEKVRNNLHFEIPERLPYNFQIDSQCEETNSIFKITSTHKKDKKGINILKFSEKDNSIYLELFYPEEGLGIDAIIVRQPNDSLKIDKLSFYEI